MSAPLVIHEMRITMQSKGVVMGLAVILDLSEEVTVSTLKVFLSYVPENFDSTADLRWKSDTGGLPNFFVIPSPAPAVSLRR